MSICLAGLIALAPVRSVAEEAAARRQFPLADGWLVRQLDSDTPDIAALALDSQTPNEAWLSARMPAQVHDVLLAHGRIDDPHVGRNAAKAAWVGEKDWAYLCRFTSPAPPAGAARLRFEGLDTLAEAWLNGRHLGHFENMFREYTVDVTDRLAPPGEENVLVIVFSSPLRFMKAAKLPPDDPAAARHRSLRKCHSDFGSYLGAAPHAVKVGVYRDVVLDLVEHAWIDDVCIRPALAADHRTAQIQVRVETGGEPAKLQWTLFDPAGREFRRGEADSSPSGAGFSIDVADPKLWWPRMQGDQNLYALEVCAVGPGALLDRRRTAFGIRTVQPVLSDPATGEKRFRFDVNGRPVFLRGGDWVPVEGATHVWQPDRAERLLELAAQGNMNVLRIWGEGVLPPESFYDECDRRGICLWQDFMFGYYDHAPDDSEFLENCRAEIEGTICRLRNHPSVLLWCGGNEQYLWTSTTDVPEAKRRIFQQMMPEACKRLDPTRLFHTSSPYGGPRGNWPLEGDWHDYTTINFAPQTSVPLFASEVLRTSVPSLASMRRFLSEEELWPAGFSPAIRKPGQPAWPPEWSYHSTGVGTWDRIGEIEEYCDPESAEELIRVIGTAHGEYLRDRVERQRRGAPDGMPDGNRRCWGNIAWRLNDAWPMIYSSVVDYYLQPKIAYYFLRRAYEPVLVSLERTPDRICAWVVNDSSEPVRGTLLVERLTLDGKRRGELQTEVALDPGHSKCCLDLTELGEISLRSEFLRATFAGREACLLLIGERYLHLPEAHLAVGRQGGSIEVTTDVFARQVEIAVSGSEALSDDNYFDLAPGQKRAVAIAGPAGGATITVRAVNAKAVSVAFEP
jgi:hypothetical protein